MSMESWIKSLKVGDTVACGNRHGYYEGVVLEVSNRKNAVHKVVRVNQSWYGLSGYVQNSEGCYSRSLICPLTDEIRAEWIAKRTPTQTD